MKGISSIVRASFLFILLLSSLTGLVYFTPQSNRVAADHLVLCDAGSDSNGFDFTYQTVEDGCGDNELLFVVPEGTGVVCFDRDIGYFPDTGDGDCGGAQQLETFDHDSAPGSSGGGSGLGQGPGGDGTDGQTARESCESEGGDFSFIACPLLKIADSAIGAFDTQVRRRVQVTESYYKGIQDENGNVEENPMREIWGRLRNIAYILLIPAVMVMVIGTALGFGFLDAYTVRRALPRLLFAVIFMALSYDVGSLMIDISNAASRGVQGLLTSALVDGPQALDLASIFNPNLGTDAALITGGVVGGSVTVLLGGVSIGILTSFMTSAAGALLLIFFILLLRELLIVGILVALPLGILLWALATDSTLWKLMWKTFTGLLFAGPIFAGFVILGRVAAYIIGRAT